MPFLAPERALAVAIMSYNGQVIIGLMGDYDAMADLDEFGEDVERVGGGAARAEQTSARTRERLPGADRPREPTVGDAQHASSRRAASCSVAPAVVLERGARAVELVAVELHHDLLVLPDGIDLLAADPDVHGGRRGARRHGIVVRRRRSISDRVKPGVVVAGQHGRAARAAPFRRSRARRSNTPCRSAASIGAPQLVRADHARKITQRSRNRRDRNVRRPDARSSSGSCLTRCTTMPGRRSSR